ncbi:hypothetical protein M422DRAFT_259833 [Sphaerobolus stellatus SS14]|uniref:Phosphatidylethanolamine-binding protein n=1 Tax=Sphaerobolus stellatus (strain SS14) TaxID=990650 RepID=A0A0C9VJW0_SPHS4|nr:hypothetical protein M422DRAFT_259833 [Sphaerobolus stellatus SS14]
MLYLQNILFSVLATATLSLAQGPNSTSSSTSNSTSPSLKLEIEAIKAHFSNAGLSPQLLATFQPEALLSVFYEDVGQIQPGQNLTSDQVKPIPTLTLTPSNSSVSLSGSYTVMMVDAGIVGTDETKGQTGHWIANGCTVSNNTITLEHSLNITDYQGPFPAEGSGAHRYAILVYVQPDSFNPPSDFSTTGQSVGPIDLNLYLNSSGIGPLFANRRTT